MNDYRAEEAEPPFATRMSPADEILDAEDVSRMFKAYLDRIRRENEAISNSL